MRSLRLASFGIRGLVGESLTPGVVIDFASAFATYAEAGTILVGRDTRISSPMLHSSVVSGLLACGCQVLDLGICPTPLLQYSVARYAAAGAISITGGHTRAGFNALTLLSRSGSYIEPAGGETVLEIYHARDFGLREWNRLGQLEPVDDFADPYFAALEAHLDAESIRKAELTVVVDAVNGAACRYLPMFAERLGLNLLPINGDESGYLAHDPEPRPRNARQVASTIGYVGADIGFLTSSDAGRLAIVSDTAETASEEYTLAVIADHVLARKPGVVVTNCCTSRAVDDIARTHGCRVVKTPVGQAFVMSAVADEDAVLGGEGNGSVGDPAFSPAFDAFLMMGLVLEAVARTGKTASELLRGFNRYHMVKKQVHAEPRRGYRALAELEHREEWLAGACIDTTDGLRADWDEGWVHVRSSRTEPVIRIISEAVARERAEERAVRLVRLLEQEL